MKKIYFYLFLLLSFSAIVCSCENKIDDKNDNNKTTDNHGTKYVDNVYLINQLNNELEIEAFIDDKISKFIIFPNETIYFTTIEYVLYEGDKTNEFSDSIAYNSLLSSIDSISVFYFGQKYTYTKSDSAIHHLLKNYTITEKGWIIKIDEDQRQQFGWGDNINLEDFFKGDRYVRPVYLVNHLDKSIDLEMHRNSLYSEYEEWYFNAGTQNFTLKPNDTVYLDTIVYHMAEGTTYFIFPGENAFNSFVYHYDFIKIDYNGKQYEYTNKADIKNLLNVINYWYIEFNEEKKRVFGWE